MTKIPRLSNERKTCHYTLKIDNSLNGFATWMYCYYMPWFVFFISKHIWWFYAFAGGQWEKPKLLVVFVRAGYLQPSSILKWLLWHMLKLPYIISSYCYTTHGISVIWFHPFSIVANHNATIKAVLDDTRNGILIYYIHEFNCSKFLNYQSFPVFFWKGASDDDHLLPC